MQSNKDRKGRVIAVVSGKGGGGKTLTVANFAALARIDGLAPLVIDMDPQASISGWCDYREDEGLIPIEYQVCNTSNLRMVEKARQEGRAVIIDTPPHHSGIARAAAEVADVIVVPTRINGVDLLALRETAEMLTAIGKASVLFLNAVGGSQKIQQGTFGYCAGLGLPVACVVKQRVSFPNAFDLGQGVHEVERPQHPARLEMTELWRAVRAAVTSQETENV